MIVDVTEEELARSICVARQGTEINWQEHVYLAKHLLFRFVVLRVDRCASSGAEQVLEDARVSPEQMQQIYRADSRSGFCTCHVDQLECRVHGR